MFSIFISLFLSIEVLNAQDRVREALDSLQNYYPQEKVWLLYNKQEFVAGETIWFSAFIFSGYNVSPISTNLFVELYSADKKLLAKKQLPVFNGQAAGNIFLDTKLEEGVYFIHAYTQWMLNFPGSGYVHQLLIYNPKSARRLQQKQLPWKAELSPEGGNFIEGMPTRFAVRLSSASPLPKNWSGYLSEKNSSDKLVSFKNLDPNVALFSFTPKDRDYQVTIEDDKGIKQVLDLTKAEPAGVQLKIDNLGDSINYTITFKDVASVGFRLIGTMNDELLYEAAIRSSVVVVKKTISTKELDNGILRLALFDKNDRLVTERLCFVKPAALELKIPAITNDQLNPLPRGSNKISFISDTIENPYSVLVIDPSTPDPMKDENFLSALWFSNDVTDPVEQPAQYFSGDGSKSNALDALLITEKLKNFDWAEVLDGRYPVIKQFPGYYISVKGTVFRGKKLVPEEDVNLIFSFPDSSTQIIQTRTDSFGVFVIQNLFFYDSCKVFYQVNSKKSWAKDIRIQFETGIRSPVTNIDPLTVSYELVPRQGDDEIPEVVNRSLQELTNAQIINDKYKIMQEVTVRTKREKRPKDKLNEELSSSLFTSFNEVVFDFVNEDQHATGYMNILLWLQGKVAGLRIDYQNGEYIPIIRGAPVSIYVDEMQLDPKFINGYPISEIAMVKVIKGFFPGAFGGGSGTSFGISGGGSGGAVCIYTRKPGMQSANTPPALPSDKLKGYDLMKDYPAPDYTDNVYSEIKTDQREVLFWKPFAISNDDMKVPIQFFNNDNAKGFRIIIIGITPSGEPVYFNRIVK